MTKSPRAILHRSPAADPQFLGERTRPKKTTSDEQDNPVAITDLRPVAYQENLHHARYETILLLLRCGSRRLSSPATPKPYDRTTAPRRGGRPRGVSPLACPEDSTPNRRRSGDLRARMRELSPRRSFERPGSFARHNRNGSTRRRKHRPRYGLLSCSITSRSRQSKTSLRKWCDR